MVHCGSSPTPTPTVAPTISSQPANATVNQGQPASFTVVASGTAPLSYQWKKDGTNLSGGTATAATFTIASAKASDAGSYTVQVSNGAGSIASGAATLTVNLPPTVQSFTVAPSVIPIGGGGVLAWTVAGANSLQVNQGVGALTPPSGTRNVAPTSTTTFTLTATNAAGSVTADATLTVDTTPFRISSFTGTPNPAPFGGSVTLNWAFTGLPLQLTVDGVQVAGNSTVVSPVRRQTYSLSGWNGASSDSRSLKVAARGLDLLAGNTDGPGFFDGLGPVAGFNLPNGVAVDGIGNIFVADTENHTIRKISPGGIVTTLAGTAGLPGSVDDVGTKARFYNPGGIIVDVNGNMFVADGENHTIRKITPGGAVTTIAGKAGTPGSIDGTGSTARFNRPRGVAIDGAGTIFVADTYNHTIRKITQAGVVSTIAGVAGVMGFVDGNGASARFKFPFSVSIDLAENIFIADYDNQVVRKITPAGMVSTLAGMPMSAGFMDGTGAEARFHRPMGVTTDNAGNVYVGDNENHVIRKVTPAGVVSTIAGIARVLGTVDGPAAEAKFYGPKAVAVDLSGNVFVADTNNNTIRSISPAGVVNTVAGKAGVFGTTDGAGSDARFTIPMGLTVDNSGNFYVADFGNGKIRIVTPSGKVTTFKGPDGLAVEFFSPRGVAIDGTGTLYVADDLDCTIRKVSPAGIVSTFAGTQFITGSTDGMGPLARFNRPWGIALDGSGNVYVADTYNHTIRKITPAGVVTTLAGAAGIPGYLDGNGTGARFQYPHSVTVDVAGNVLVADSFNYTIRKISPTGFVTTVAGRGGYDGSVDGSGSTARFGGPVGLSVDRAGNIFVADTYNHTIRIISPEGMVSTLAGTARMQENGPGPLPGYLCFPFSVVITPDGDLVVTTNHGLLQITAPIQ